jgi:hypothetical protein
MANTVIQLKYSDVTSAPTTLATAEVAYSNNSNKLYIGQSDGTVVAIGGKYYTGLVDAATSANTASAIVKRDADGNFTAATITANLSGNATTATTWRTARTLGLSGDATGTMSVDGSSNQNISVVLASTGVSAGTYGGATQIPTFAVDAKGRLTSAGNVAISTSFGIAGDTGTGTVAGGETLTIVGRDGITTVAADANNSILVDVDNTVVRTTGGTISGDLAITGNLVVSGNTITQDVETVVVQDSLVKYANNNSSDALDIGFFGQYNDGSTKYTALFRDASDSGKYKLLTGGTTEPSAANTVDTTTFSTATLVADLEATTVTIKGLNVLDRANSGITIGGLAFDKANAANVLAQSAYDLANTLAGGTATDGFARTTANAAFDKANSANVLAQAAFNQANTDFTNISTTAGTYGSAAIVPVFTLAANGRVSSVTNTTIAIGASAITSGTLGVARGGTGFSSYTANGVIVGGVTSTSALISVASSTEGHVLQISSSGIPTFAHLNGGSF